MRCWCTRHLKYDGLSGGVKTGCPNTPEYKSRYCSLHIPFVARSSPVHFSNEPSITNSVAESTVAMIIDKRQIRQSTFYKVCHSQVQCM